MLAIYARTSKENAYDRDSPIEQQIQSGIEFAKSHNLQYQIYADKGISGYKIADDDSSDPFSLRPEFSQLIEDIRKPYDKKGKIPSTYKGEVIDAVWVWENSRLARNIETATYIYRIFEKYNVKVFVKDKEVNYKNSADKFMLGILNLVAQYERDLIVARTTRGFYESVDSGKRAHAKFYGYKKLGRNKDKNYLWEPVENELDEIRFAYKEFLSGKSLRQIALGLWGIENNNGKELHRVSKLARFLAHAEYTGYNLKMSGLEILHKFEEYEIPDLHLLKEDKYWVKSIPYSVELISREDWITVREKLIKNKKARNDNKQLRTADKSVGTGIIKCACCGMSYFYYRIKDKDKHGETKYYEYYYHHKSLNNKLCTNRPKSLNIPKTDAILETWYVFWLMVFDRSEELTNEQLELMEIEKKSLQSKIKDANKKIKDINVQIVNFNKALSESQSISTDVILQLSTQIANRENQITEIKSEIIDYEAKLQKLTVETERAENDKIFNSMHNLIENYRNGSIEEKRNLIIKVLGDGKAVLTDSVIRINKNDIKCSFYIKKDYSGYAEKIHDYFTSNPEVLKNYIFEIRNQNLHTGYENNMTLLWKKQLEFADCKINLTKVGLTEEALEKQGFNVSFDFTK